MTPFPHPAHRTGQADFPHPALGQDFTPLLSRATPSAVSEHCLELIGCPISMSFATYCVCLSLHRHYPASAVLRTSPPKDARPVPRGRPVRYGLHTRAVTVYRDSLSEGFSHFVSSIAAPVASGWSVRQVGFAPTGKAPPFHGARHFQTHALQHSGMYSITSSAVLSNDAGIVAHRLGSLKIDNQFVLGREFDRQIARFGCIQNLAEETGDRVQAVPRPFLE